MGVADGAVGRRSCGGWTGGLDGGWRGFFGWFGFLKILGFGSRFFGLGLGSLLSVFPVFCGCSRFSGVIVVVLVCFLCP